MQRRRMTNGSHSRYEGGRLVHYRPGDVIEPKSRRELQQIEPRSEPFGKVEPEPAPPTPSAEDSEPLDPDVRANRIQDVIRRMPHDEAHFTKAGKPSANALEDYLGWHVPGAERDEVWERMNE